jgi:hypothetical protein
MLKEPVHLSDWIQYFISIKTLCFTIIGMLSSGIIAISTILLNFSSNLNIVAFIELNLIEYSFAIIALWLVFSKKSPLIRSTKLFNEIMQRTGEIEVNKISKEWYGGKKKMKKADYGKWEMVFLYIALILSALSLIFAIIGTSSTETPISFLDLFTFLLPVAIAFFSLHFASHSIVIADESDRKMKAIANVEFLKIVNMIEDARILFIRPIYRIDTYTWKTRNSIEMAVELIKRDKENNYIEPKYMQKLWDYFILSLNHFLRSPNFKKEKASNEEIYNNSMNHIAESFAMLEEYYDNKNITEFNAHVDADFKNDIKDEKIKEEFLALIKAAKERLSK